MKNFIFVRLDADNVGDKIELFLLENNWSSAQKTHDSVQNGMKEINEYIESLGDVQFLMVGCDDILFRIDKTIYKENILNNILKIFHDCTSMTLSFGIGETSGEAILNLRKAKLSGKNKIVKD